MMGKKSILLVTVVSLLLNLNLVGSAIGKTLNPSIIAGKFKILKVDNRWGKVSDETTELMTDILVNQPNLYLLPLKLSCSLYMNGIKMTKEVGKDFTIRKEKGGSLISFTSLIQHNLIPKWWVRHIRNGETTFVEIKGKIIINLLGINITYPFSWNKSFKTDILKGLNITKSQEAKIGPLKLRIEKISSHWGKITDRITEINHTVYVYNESYFPIPTFLNTVYYKFIALQVPLGEGKITLPGFFLPRGESKINFTTKMINKELTKWWINHIKNNEKTTYLFQYMWSLNIMGNKIIKSKWYKNKGEFTTNLAVNNP